MTAKLDIHKVGFFHVDSTSCPIKSLREHLEAAQRHLSDCLVVLPEALNYWPYSKDGFLDTSVENCLHTLSARFNVVLVAGLIEKRWLSWKLGYSSARLIDGSMCHVLSRKTEKDGLVDYRPYSVIYNKPLLYRGVQIAALICMDASINSACIGPMRCREEARKRFRDREAKLEKIPKGQRVALCIPSRMEQNASAEVAKDWHRRLPNSVVILANAPTCTNSAPREPSVIEPERALIYSECRGGNTLRIVSWPEIPC